MNRPLPAAAEPQMRCRQQVGSLRVVHADEDIVVVDKPAGMPSVAARTPLDPPCVAAELRAAYGPLEAVHRLDRDTSGLLVLARSPRARSSLGRAFEDRTVKKRYEAVVEGLPASPGGIVHLPLAADPARPPRYRVDPILGRPAVTRWRMIVAELGPKADPPRSLLELEPITGRSHQLRVHLAWLGMPIVGDRLYGPRAVPAAIRLALHAVWLAFPHPRDGRAIEVRADPPDWPRLLASASWPSRAPPANTGKTGRDP